MTSESLEQDYSEELVGTKMGRYELTEYLGHGAMARVFKAHHQLLDRYVAVKVLHPPLAADKEFVTQFIREARTLANLQHANIVQVYDIDIEKNLPYLVMEYIDGETLKSALATKRESRKRFSIKKCIRFIQYVGGALSYAHKQDMIHRDVKPANVLLENTGRIVLADFGLAKINKGVSSTLTGTVKGTPAYMSPEQGLGKPGGGRSDLYSLGVMFYELVTGQLPFTADNPFAIVMKHVNDAPPAPQSVATGIPAKVEEVILKALEKKPEKRYKNVDSMLKEISALAQAKTGALPTARLSLSQGLAPGTLAPTVTDNAQVSLHIMDTGQILYLTRGKKYTLGRYHKSATPDIDLTPFNAYEWGISRMHAEIEVGDSVIIRDLDSSNGTRYNGEKLTPHIPVEIQHGDTIKLGKLKIQILVYD